jgi:YD repeat-containing protein
MSATLLSVLAGSHANAVEPLVTLEDAKVIATEPGKNCSNNPDGTCKTDKDCNGKKTSSLSRFSSTLSAANTQGVRGVTSATGGEEDPREELTTSSQGTANGNLASVHVSSIYSTIGTSPAAQNFSDPQLSAAASSTGSFNSAQSSLASTSSCSSCTVTPSLNDADRENNNLPELALAKIHNSRELYAPSSLAPGAATNYDTHLVRRKSFGEDGFEIYDPQLVQTFRYTDPDSDGVYKDPRNGGGRHLEILDASGAVVTDPDLGVRARLTGWDGQQFTFDLVDLSGATDGALAQGLQLSLQADDAGNVLLDSSPSAHTVTTIDGQAVTTVAGPLGTQALSLPDGTALQVAGYTGPATGEAFTVSTWIKVDPNALNRSIVQWGQGNNHYRLSINSGAASDKDGALLTLRLGKASVVTDAIVADGSWHHVAVTMPAGALGINEAKLYVDGVQMQYTDMIQKSLFTDTSSALFKVGRTFVSGNAVGKWGDLDGAVDDLRVYDRALRASEISSLAVDQPVIHGRLASMADRNGYETTVTYQTNPGDDYLGSPSRQLMIDSVSDAYGRSMQFAYRTAQEGGRWVVDQVTVPGGDVVSFDYLNERLSSVQLRDGDISTISYSYDPDSQATVVSHVDPAAVNNQWRKRDVHLSNNYSLTGVDLVIQPIGFTRLIANGDNEVAYLSTFNGNNRIIFEGGLKAKNIPQNFKKVQTYENISFDASASNPVSGDLEASSPRWSASMARMNIKKMIDRTGREYNFVRNTAGSPTLITYTDGTREEKSYNQFEQITRHRDRLGRVTRWTYDARGNLLSREVGLTSPAINKPHLDVQAADGSYAVFSYEYYPAGHPNQFRKSAAIDANGNRTDYVYNADQMLATIIEPADQLGDARAEQHFTYDAAQRLIAHTDPVGRTTRFAYDQRDRLVLKQFHDDSTERIVYGAVGSPEANLVIHRKDRNNQVTSFQYDGTGRRIQTTVGAHTMDAGDLNAPLAAPVLTAVADATQRIDEFCEYLPGTDLEIACVKAGERTEYTYDYRHRLIATTVFPLDDPATALTSQVVYDSTNNERRATIDPYRRATLFAYRVSDQTLLRQVRETLPGVLDPTTLSSADVLALNHILPDEDADFLIHAYERDAEKQLTAQIDPRGIRHETDFDTRGRRVAHREAAGTAVEARTAWLYDAQSNVIEQRSPRYFDAGDSRGFGKASTTMTYTGRNLLASRTEAPGTLEEATEFFAYFLDKRRATKTDGRGNIWATLWHVCCGRLQAQIDPLGHGTIQNTDFYGNITHTAVVAHLPTDVTAYNWHDPIDADTISETTTRFDNRHRPTHRTVWLQPLGFVNDHARLDIDDALDGGGVIPIAGEDGIPAADGLTTRYFYDDNLANGLDISAAILGYSVDLSGLSFGALADGSAVAVQNPAGETNLAIKDGRGRTLRAYDGEVEISQTITYDQLSLGETVATATDTSSPLPDGLLIAQRTDAVGNTTKSYSDGAGRTRFSRDAAGFTSQLVSDGNGNRVSTRDANGVGQDCTFDARNREVACTDTQGDTTTRVYDANNNTVVTTDALLADETCFFDARNRKVLCVDRINAATAYTYDANNNLLSITDADPDSDGDGLIGLTRYMYDERNLLVREEFPTHVVNTNPGQAGNDARLYAYDAGQRLVRRVDQLDDHTTYSYDLANRLVTRGYPDALDDTFQYDAASRLTQASSARYSNVVNRTYNADSTLATEELVIDGATHTITHGYDAANRMISCTYPTGAVRITAWTQRNQLDSITYAGDVVANLCTMLAAAKRAVPKAMASPPRAPIAMITWSIQLPQVASSASITCTMRTNVKHR